MCERGVSLIPLLDSGRDGNLQAQSVRREKESSLEIMKENDELVQ